MKQWFALVALSLLLAACGHGKTDPGNAPGFRNGKPTHPLVKLGNPYDVDGETYYPKYEPDYVEEGMASWYGPGFHGKSTANGESFNANEMTAAHRTLPIPSIVRVTHLKSGRSAIVRVNDRGPFASNRIIDLSKAAASRIGMLGEGVAKVRVEYLPEESRKYISLLENGRTTKNINVERDVMMAGGSFSDASKSYQSADNSSWFDRINPISSARASEPMQNQVIPVETTTTNELPPLEDAPPPSLPPAQDTATQPVAEPANPAPARSPFDLLPAAEQPIIDPVQPAETVTKPVVVGDYAVQLGVFGNQGNAQALKQRFNGVADTDITEINSNGRTLYRVRLGPFVDEVEARKVLDRARTMGVPDAKVIKP